MQDGVQGKRRRLPDFFTAPPAQQSAQARGPCPRMECPLPIHYAVMEDECERAVLLIRDAPVLGFDIEWHVTFERGKAPDRVAVVQLCSPDHCVVLHVYHCGIPPPLRDLLASESTQLLGVNVAGDVAKLELEYSVRVANAVELGVLADKALGATPTKWSLAALAEQLLGATVGKEAEIRTGDWRHRPLNRLQLLYAATDAYAALRCYEALQAVLARKPARKVRRLADTVPRVSEEGDAGTVLSVSAASRATTGDGD